MDGQTINVDSGEISNQFPATSATRLNSLNTDAKSDGGAINSLRSDSIVIDDDETTEIKAIPTNLDDDHLFLSKDTEDAKADLTLTDLRQDIDVRLQEDEEIEKALLEGGEPAAVLKKMDQLKLKFARDQGFIDSSGTVDEKKLDDFMKTESGKVLEEKFYEQIKAELGYTDESNIPEDERIRIQAEAKMRAEEYQKKSWKEILGEGATLTIENVDLGTFILAVVGKDVGDGRYGSHSPDKNSEQNSDLSTTLIEMLQKHPEHQAEILKAGCSACKRYDLQALIDNPGEKEALERELEILAKDPKKAKLFVWGMYNVFGLPVEGSNISAEQAEFILENLSEQIKNGTFLHISKPATSVKESDSH